MERRNSHSNSDEPAPPPASPDVFDDDYEVDLDEDDFMPSVSDGFRPATMGEGEHAARQDHDRNEALQRHTSTSKPADHSLRRTATRNSTAKVRGSVMHDGRLAGAHHRAPSPPTPLGHRASVSSTGSFATTSNGDNPFETGPSHPYGMYPQDTMARAPSVAASTTDARPQRPMSLQRPTHPYALYSQSGLDDGLDEDPLVEAPHPRVPPIQTAIPLGFPGLNNGYHRVLGPDGEEQDIIGPDGHTEQLPPYTRFPDAGPTKASLAAEASASSRVLPAPNTIADPEDPFLTPVSPVSPLSANSFSTPDLPVIPLLPSITPARLPPQRPETQTGNVAPVTSTYVSATQVPAEPSDSASASLLSTEQGFTEKAEPAPTKTVWYKKKLWGKVPVGVVVAVLVLLIVFVIALGAAVGTTVARKQGNKKNPHHGRPHDEP
jgi:hypothetical protein